MSPGYPVVLFGFLGFSSNSEFRIKLKKMEVSGLSGRDVVTFIGCKQLTCAFQECALLAESDHPMIMVRFLQLWDVLLGDSNAVLHWMHVLWEALVKTFETDQSVYILTECARTSLKQ
eukprot:2258070-Amphidinium_carterae.1